MSKSAEQALLLAKDGREADPEVTAIYWFPHESEVRLVELCPTAPRPKDETRVHPFYFRPSPDDNLPLPTAVAIIHTDMFRKLALPAGWGTWDDARKLEAAV